MKKLLIIICLIIAILAQTSNQTTIDTIVVDIYFNNGEIANYKSARLDINAFSGSAGDTSSVIFIVETFSGRSDSSINLYDIDKIVTKNINGEEMNSISGIKMRVMAEAALLSTKTTAKTAAESIRLTSNLYAQLKKYLPIVIIGGIILILTTIV